MRKFLLVFICCIFICGCAYRCGGFCTDDIKVTVKQQLYRTIQQFFSPQVVYQNSSGKELVYEDLEKVVFPALSCSRGTNKYEVTLAEQKNAEILKNNSSYVGQESEGSSQKKTVTETENTESAETTITVENNNMAEEPVTSPADSGKKVVINREKLKDFDYLRQNFYQVDNTTTVDSSLLDVSKLVEKDMRLAENVNGPQVLIYHTHSQEGYTDSAAGDPNTSVMAVGNYLTELLISQYGIQVLHHTGTYDVNDRDHAYSNALPALQQILSENPTIEVVIDLHRDGVPEASHLVTEVDGRPTAQIMFFNGLSRTTSQGELTYLPNPYIENNLALSFQLQLVAEEYYPGLARRIYLKGFRYNQHLCSKSILVEVGAQNNSFEEAKNAMIPLADILTKVLKGET